MIRFFHDIHIYVLGLAKIMRQKLVTLCTNTFRVAKGMNNFSKWVRGELNAFQDGEDREYWKEECFNLRVTLAKVRDDGMYWDKENKTWRFPK